jgi:general secretion pathway protein J
MKSRASAGITLMELLIAVSLVGMLSVGILMSMRVGLNAMVRTNENFLVSRRILGAQRILEQQIAGFMPVIADCVAGGEEKPTARVPFFQGEPQAMRFVSSYSIEEAARGYPRILEFAVVPAEGHRGVRLVVTEHLYTGPRSAGMFCFGLAMDPIAGAPGTRFRPVEAGPRAFVLADRLAFCRFLFHETTPPPVNERWVPQWGRLYQWPDGIRVEMQPLEPDRGRLQVLTVTAPIRVRRNLRIAYVD